MKKKNIQGGIEFWSHLMEVLKMNNNSLPKLVFLSSAEGGFLACFLGFWKNLSRFSFSFSPSPLLFFHKCFLSTYYVP